VLFSVFNCWYCRQYYYKTVELVLSEVISVLKYVYNNYELFYCCSYSRPFALHCNYLIWAAMLRRDGDCCGREKLALLQLPVLVKYRIALVLVPVANDSRILSAARILLTNTKNIVATVQLLSCCSITTNICNNYQPVFILPPPAAAVVAA
jgi:hypothetical protein